MATIADVISAVATRLQYVAPTATGRKELHRNVVAPVYVWVPVSITHQGPGSIGRNPRSLGDDLKSVDVYCTGETLANAERLRQSLLTALRIELVGRNYQVGESRYGTEDDFDAGFSLVVNITIVMPLPYARIPTSPGGSLEDDTQGYATVATVGLDGAPATAGDGILTSSEG